MSMFKLCAASLLTVLAVAPLSAAARSTPTSQIDLDVAVGTPVLLTGQPNRAYVKIALTGFERDADATRVPANVAIVLDRSSSMNGAKIARAREAAIMAVRRLSANDVVSVVAYGSTVEVLIPATRVGNGQSLIESIRGIRATGSTALFAGVAKGADQVRKFMSTEHVNRVILLSDGLANVGPSTPTELGRLGQSLGAEGISVTTIGLGLGYNEDLMTQLAGYSDGNHAFVENATDLARVFSYEFGDVLSVVASDVMIEIRCANGIRPIRLLGRPAEISGQTVRTRLNQLQSRQEKYVVLEVEVPPQTTLSARPLADVEVQYLNLATQARNQLQDQVAVRFTESREAVSGGTNQAVQAESMNLSANETAKQAVKLRDEGRVDEAKSLLREEAEVLRQAPLPAAAPALEAYADELESDAESLEDEGDWRRNRKALKAKQYKRERQQTY